MFWREGAVLGNGPKKRWNNFLWLRIKVVLVTQKKFRWEAEKTEFYYNRFYLFILFAEMYITRSLASTGAHNFSPPKGNLFMRSTFLALVKEF